MGMSLSPSSVTLPPGPDSVMVARLPSHPARTGTAKAKLELPSPSAVAGMVKLSEKSWPPPPPVRPVIRNSPAESGSAAGASTTNAGSR